MGRRRRAGSDGWQERVRTHSPIGEVSEAALKSVLDTTRYQKADVTSGRICGLDRFLPRGTCLVFCATSVGDRRCLYRTPAGIAARKRDKPRAGKPFGTDHESAADLNKLLAQLVPENQVHRVDHFLGRSTVLNLIGVRFANRLFEPVWSNEHIDRVDIVFDEQLTLENRARYYDHAGAWWT